jgi:anti-anti-sigma regulatory factor
MTPFALDEADGASRFVLSGNCTVEEASDASQALAKALAENDAVILDISGVEYADITFVQLLLAAAQAAADRGKRLELSGEPSQAAQDALRLSGVTGDPLILGLFGRSGLRICMPGGR